MNIIDRQTFVISVDLSKFYNTPPTPNIPAEITCPINLRFAADTLMLKSLSYNVVAANPDIDNMVVIWCSITNDGLITAFPNNTSLCEQLNQEFSLSNTFQNGNVNFQFQKSNTYIEPFYYNSQRLISDPSAPTNITQGILSLTIEFLKHDSPNVNNTKK